MTTGVAKVGPPEGAAHGHVPPPDLSRAGEVLRELRGLWPDERLTPFVGITGDRVCVGFVTDRYRKAVRFSALTFEAALRRATMWTAHNGWRVRWEAKNDSLDHPERRLAPPAAERPKEG